MSRMGRRVCAILGALLAVTCTAAPAGSVDDPELAVAELLQQRVAAIAGKDATAYMATIDPRAPVAFRDAQRKQFDGMISVPFVDMELVTTTVDSGDLAPGLALTAKHQSQDSFMPETQLRYRLAVYDDRRMIDSYWYTYVQRDNEWYVASDNDAGVIGLDSAKNLWDNGPLSAQSTDHFLVLSSTEHAARGSTLASIAEQGMTRFAQQWSRPWPQRVPLLIPPTPEEAARLLRTTADVANFTAFTAYSPVRDAGWNVTPPRLYAQDANLAANSATRQAGTIVHELTHVAASYYTGPFTPTWLQEGLAEWIRLGKPTSFSLEAGVEKALPGPEDFVVRDRTELSRAYDLATSAVVFLAATEGPSGPFEFLEATGRQRVVAGSPAYNVDRAMHEATGQGFADFEAAWKAW